MSKLEKEIKIGKYNFFPIEFFKINVKESLNEELIKNKLYSLKQNSPTPPQASKGGWQSHKEINFYPEFALLIKFISQFINQTFSSRCKIKEMWGSIYSINDYNSIHNHPSLSPSYDNSPLWSGVYYLQTFPNSGELNLHSHANVSNYQSFPPSNKDLVLFNSSTYHSVNPNLEKEDKICIAFNLELL